MSEIDNILVRLADLVTEGRFEELESDTLEIKPVPGTGGDWRERYKSANAFLNTRGGILILGIKEVGQGADRRYIHSGYYVQGENKIKEMTRVFTDKEHRALDLTESFPTPQIRPFLDGRVCLVFVDELSAEKKFCFYHEDAYKRILTGDHRITEQELESQEEYKQELWQARELQPVKDATQDDLDVDKLNQYIQLLNRTVRVETIKPDIDAALTFLERKGFIQAGIVTTLGVLVCGSHPGDLLGYRCHLHGYVELPGVIAQDKQDYIDNVLPLMESGFAYLQRNIQVGVSTASGGSNRSQYPEQLLRETINNALAHRDYSIDRQVIVTVKPGEHISIANPGAFRRMSIVETPNSDIRLLRILPEAKPRNPRLADVLRVYRKWEGRGIGMATLVSLSLEDLIDLPYYRLRQDEVELFVCTGNLLDEKMQQLLTSFNGYTKRKLGGSELNRNQRLVLSYLIKSEMTNRLQRHTILLTPDNNHYSEIHALERAGLIYKHPDSPSLYPLYIPDRELMKQDYVEELRGLFGEHYDALNENSRACLNALYRYQYFSEGPAPNAKQIGRYLWANRPRREDEAREFDNYTRSIRYSFNRLTAAGLIVKEIGKSGYRLNIDYLTSHIV